MTRNRRFIAIAVAGIIIVGAVALYLLPQQQQTTQNVGGRGRPRGPTDAPIPVLVATAHPADVPVYLEGVGTARGLNTVTVRPQVDGKLISVAFKEGQDVQKGYVLARIDPTTYQAQLDQAVAKKAQDEAQLANANLDLDRYTRLAATNSVTKQQADTQRAMVAQLQAQVKSDQAAIDNARAIVAYTTITAPINGRTGIRQVDEGNIVRSSDATGIVVITEIRPISVIFSLPQQVVAQVNTAFAKGPLSVEALASDNAVAVDKGTLQVVDNQVDQTTGTVKLRAEFPNASLQLWPGQFVNVRMLIDTKRNVIVVPTAAVQRGPNGPFVFVVQPDNTATVRLVTVSQQDDVQAVIASGVQAGDRVVTTGFAQLSEGSRVNVATSEGGAPPAVSSTPNANRRQQNRPPGPDAARPDAGGARPAGAARAGQDGASSAGAAPSQPP
ncbi:MAG: rane fusion protein multidrug efflux system [Alphaproteobacteria bacterium]|nr:rane fusion protein multidrug efflux system [Alphaproteobacteria bacterium]